MWEAAKGFAERAERQLSEAATGFRVFDPLADRHGVYQIVFCSVGDDGHRLLSLTLTPMAPTRPAAGELEVNVTSRDKTSAPCWKTVWRTSVGAGQGHGVEAALERGLRKAVRVAAWLSAEDLAPRPLEARVRSASSQMS